MGIIPSRELIMACTPQGNRSDSQYKKHVDELVRQYTKGGNEYLANKRRASTPKRKKVGNVWLIRQRDGTYFTTVPMLPFAKRMPVRIEICMVNNQLDDLAVEKMIISAIKAVQQIARRSKSLYKRLQTLLARHLNAVSEVRRFEKDLGIEQVSPVRTEPDIWKRIARPRIVVQFCPKMEVAIEWSADWDHEYPLIVAVIGNGRKLQIDERL